MYVEIKELSFRYKNSKVDTIQNFNIDIEKGQIVCILGQSGSGKSTILRLLSGLESPADGMIKIGERTMVDNETFILPEGRGIGMVFQDYALFPHMTVEKNIKFGLKKMSGGEKNKRLNEVLQLVNLTEYKRRYPYELSGGQQQRVALARALAPKPSLLLLDEPFSNLDSALQEKIREELKAILKQAGITSVFVTHDRNDAAKIADSIVILEEGQIIKKGTVQDVLELS